MIDLYRPAYTHNDNMSTELCKLQTWQEKTKNAKLGTQIPKTQNMVKAMSLANAGEEKIATACTALLVEAHGQQYIVKPTQMVPAQAQIVRDQQGAMVGIPAIAGGSAS